MNQFSDLVLAQKKKRLKNLVSPNSSGCIYCNKYYNSNSTSISQSSSKSCSQCHKDFFHVHKNHESPIKQSKSKFSKKSNCTIKTAHDHICCENCVNLLNNNHIFLKESSESDPSNKAFHKSSSSHCIECSNKKEATTNEKVQNQSKKNNEMNKFRILDKIRHNTKKTRGQIFNGEEVIDMIFHNDDFTDCS